MPEHRAKIEIFLWKGIRCPIMLNEGAYGARCAFRTKSERCPIAVLKGVHLLFDDIGRGADAAGKQGGDFKDGQTDLLKPRDDRPAAGRFFDEPPARCLFREVNL